MVLKNFFFLSLCLIGSTNIMGQTNYYTEAKNLSRQGNLDAAISMLDKIIETDSNYVHAVHFKVDLLNDDQHLTQLIPALERQSNFVKEGDILHYMNRKKIAIAHFKLGNFEKSLVYFEGLIKEKTTTELEEMYLEACIAAKAYDKAIKFAEPKLKNGNLFQMYTGVAQFQLGRYSEAKTTLTSFLDAIKDEKNYIAPLFLAKANVELKKKKEICQPLDKAMYDSEYLDVARQTMATAPDRVLYQDYYIGMLDEISKLQDKFCENY